MPYGKSIEKLRYKANVNGIMVIQVNESYTSQTCSKCGTIDKTNGAHRGPYN